MRPQSFVLLLNSLLVFIGHVSAQAPFSGLSPRPVSQELTTGGQVCAAGRVKSAHRQATASVPHRRKMDRYDVKFYKLDIALENTSLNVAGSVLMLSLTRSGIDCE